MGAAATAAAGRGGASAAVAGHLTAVLGMVGVTLLWSSAGLVTRRLDSAASFETTFWRSAFCALALAAWCAGRHGRVTPARLPSGTTAPLRRDGRALWLSGAMWAVMFTCFMVAMTLTTVANVLVTMSLAPLFTALLARFALGQPLPRRTWLAMVFAGAGVAWMYGGAVGAGSARQLLGSAVALGVPLAAAVNWTTLQRRGRDVDLVPALLIAGVLSCAATLPFAWPLRASPHDIALLALLGVFQLALPCVLAVRLARRLAAPEMSLLALLEIVFGIALAWWGAGEAPAPRVLAGGTLVLGALAANEALWLLERRAAPGRRRAGAAAGPTGAD